MEKKFFLATLLLLLALVIGLKQQQNPPWADYQNAYFEEQKLLLQKESETTVEEAKKLALQRELKDWEGRKPEIVNLVLPNGEVERCKTCHIGIEEISASHPSETFGCTVCHGGNPLSLDKKTAHDNMLGGGHPGSLDVVALSCGRTGPNDETCHSRNLEPEKNEVDNVKTSIMATKAGELSFIRRTFGLDQSNEVPDLVKGGIAFEYPNPLGGLPQEKKFQESCLSMCHQGGGGILPGNKSSEDKSSIGKMISDKTSSAKVNQSIAPSAKIKPNTAQGCEVCHVLTNSQHTYQGADTSLRGFESGRGKTHQLTTQIPYTQCNQCHNQGWHDPVRIEFTYRPDLEKVIQHWDSGDRSLFSRLNDYYLPGELFVKCEVSLDCIDCHTRWDVMGDGKKWTSQSEAVHLQCRDCHGTTDELPLTKTIESLEDLAFRRKITNPIFPDLQIGDRILVTEAGEELPFLRAKKQEWILYGRVEKSTFTIPLVQGSACQQDPKEQGVEACHKCHDQPKLHP